MEVKCGSRDRVAVEGASAGKVLVAAALNMRADVCAARVVVTVVDAVTTTLAFNSWWAFGVAFVLVMFNTHAGNTRWAATRQ